VETTAPLAAAAAVPPGAAALEEEWPILGGPAAAAVVVAAASAAKVFLLRLPCGRPRFRGIGGFPARPPSGRPRSLDSSPAPAPPFASDADIKSEAGVVEATVPARQMKEAERSRMRKTLGGFEI
jgi:hypothetical protein